MRTSHFKHSAHQSGDDNVSDDIMMPPSEIQKITALIEISPQATLVE